MTKTRPVRSLVLFGLLVFIAPAAQSAPFPEPDAVVQGFCLSSQQLAALQVVEVVTLEKEQPQSPADYETSFS